jgi:hypothetical protein
LIAFHVIDQWITVADCCLLLPAAAAAAWTWLALETR